MACLDNRGKDSKWEKVILIFNCSDKSGFARLPEGSWQILADGENTFRWEKPETVTGQVHVPEYSAMILGLA